MARLETEGSGPSLNRMSSFGPQGSAPSMSAGGRVGAFVQTLNLETLDPWRTGGCLRPTQRPVLARDALSAGGGPRPCSRADVHWRGSTTQRPCNVEEAACRVHTGHGLVVRAHIINMSRTTRRPVIENSKPVQNACRRSRRWRRRRRAWRRCRRRALWCASTPWRGCWTPSPRRRPRSRSGGRTCALLSPPCGACPFVLRTPVAAVQIAAWTLSKLSADVDPHPATLCRLALRLAMQHATLVPAPC
jgi:hypothetical protein